MRVSLSLLSTLFAKARSRPSQPITDQDQKNAQQQLIAEALDERVAPLFQRLGLDIYNKADRWQFILAVSIPLTASQPGRPKTWTDEDIETLKNQVNELAARKPNWSQRSVCVRLTKIKDGPFAGFSPESLRSALRRA